jgi:glyoxylase-like metal-dependent hydrolase (beta-lactamase superfamily II)
MRIAENVEMLELGRPDKGGAVYPVLFWDEKDVALVDTGFPGQLEELRGAVAAAGFALEQITKVVLTHQDLDHIGCAKELAELGAGIFAHELEAPYLRGELPPVRTGSPKLSIRIDKALKDGETVNICGGVKAIHTPGHMPGHMAVLLIKSGTLIAGDGANIQDGSLAGANPVYTQDIPLAELSFEKMKALQPHQIVAYHCGLYKNG